MQHVYAAIGRAVFFAQLFETALIPIFEFFKMQTEPGYLKNTAGRISAGAFKVPVKNIIKALSTTGSISPDLEERLSRYVEDRHLLIHRWVQEHGWPDDNDAEGFVPILELANRVEAEAKQLTRSFAGYMTKFANPEWAAQHADEYKAKIAQLFHQAHIAG
jgi:hypothetical protein